MRPDLIVVDDTTGSRNSLDDLAKIALTVLVAKYAQGWERYFGAMATILNRPDQHKRVLGEISAMIAATGSWLPPPRGQTLTASVVRWSSEA